MMKLQNVRYLLFFTFVIIGCKGNLGNNEKSERVLQPIYSYFDQLSENEFHFIDLEHKLNSARGKNITKEIDKYTKEFGIAQASCIKKMEEKFPAGSVQIPFEQIHGKDTITVKSVNVSGYSFPWQTATAICFYFTVEYEIHKENVLFIQLSVKFIDVENDIINYIHLSANSSGKSRTLVNTQFTFRDLKKVIIND